MADGDIKTFDEFYPELVQCLPLKDANFLDELTRQHLFSGNLKEKVMKASTQADAATVFLDEAIKRPLSVGNRETFDKLLLVMEEFDLLLKVLAEVIKQKLSDNVPQNDIPG